MYTYIINPKTNIKVNTKSLLGRKIINNYILQGGSDIDDTFELISVPTEREEESTLYDSSDYNVILHCCPNISSGTQYPSRMHNCESLSHDAASYLGKVLQTNNIDAILEITNKNYDLYRFNNYLNRLLRDPRESSTSPLYDTFYTSDHDCIKSSFTIVKNNTLEVAGEVTYNLDLLSFNLEGFCNNTTEYPKRIMSFYSTLLHNIQPGFILNLQEVALRYDDIFVSYFWVKQNLNIIKNIIESICSNNLPDFMKLNGMDIHTFSPIGTQIDVDFSQDDDLSDETLYKEALVVGQKDTIISEATHVESDSESKSRDGVVYTGSTEVFLEDEDILVQPRIVPKIVSDGVISAIVYDSSSWDLIKSDDIYRKIKDIKYNKKSNAYLFQHKLDENIQIVVINIHLKALSISTLGKTKPSPKHTDELNNILTIAKNISNDFNIPVFLAGDFNNTINKEQFIKEVLQNI